MRYCARDVEQVDRESKKARIVAPENTEEELPPNSGGRVRARRHGSHLVREVERKSLMEPGLRRL